MCHHKSGLKNLSPRDPVGATTPSAANRRPSIAFAAAWAVSLAMVAAGGCHKGLEGAVPVSGKLTFKGGAWNKPGGEVIFSPISTSAGGRFLPAMAKIAPDGSFKARTGVSDGVMPGEYGVVVRCMTKEPDEDRPGQSELPARYSFPSTSGLKLSVPDGSGPINLEWNIEDK